MLATLLLPSVKYQPHPRTIRRGARDKEITSAVMHDRAGYQNPGADCGWCPGGNQLLDIAQGVHVVPSRCCIRGSSYNGSIRVWGLHVSKLACIRPCRFCIACGCLNLRPRSER